MIIKCQVADQNTSRIVRSWILSILILLCIQIICGNISTTCIRGE